jgi:glycosyltransferase involved in cell wall biosynthesis
MKIVFVNNQYQLGGAETVVQQLHFGCLRAGHQSELHVADGKTYPRVPGLVPMYPRWMSRMGHSTIGPLFDMVFPRYRRTDRAFRRLADSEADLVHIHSFHGIYASLESLAAVAARKPVLWTFHRFWGITGGCDHPFDCTRYLTACGQCPRVGEWPIGPVDRTAEELQRKLALLAPAPLHIISPSRHLAEKVKNSPVGKKWDVHHIPNGVDPAGFSARRKPDPAFRKSFNIPAGATSVLVVNRNFHDPIKGWGTIRQALQALPPEGAHLLLAGGNSDRAAATLPAGWRCTNLGYISSRERLGELYEAADIFLYASPGENYPCVILEAMSAECCIVSTPTDGVREQIEHGRSGLFARDMSGVSLAAALREALANPARCRELGRHARERVERELSEQAMVKRHLELYEQLLAKRN